MPYKQNKILKEVQLLRNGGRAVQDIRLGPLGSACNRFKLLASKFEMDDFCISYLMCLN